MEYRIRLYLSIMNDSDEEVDYITNLPGSGTNLGSVKIYTAVEGESGVELGDEIGSFEDEGNGVWGYTLDSEALDADRDDLYCIVFYNMYAGTPGYEGVPGYYPFVYNTRPMILNDSPGSGVDKAKVLYSAAKIEELIGSLTALITTPGVSTGWDDVRVSDDGPNIIVTAKHEIKSGHVEMFGIYRLAYKLFPGGTTDISSFVPGTPAARDGLITSPPLSFVIKKPISTDSRWVGEQIVFAYSLQFQNYKGASSWSTPASTTVGIHYGTTAPEIVHEMYTGVHRDDFDAQMEAIVASSKVLQTIVANK